MCGYIYRNIGIVLDTLVVYMDEKVWKNRSQKVNGGNHWVVILSVFIFSVYFST